MLNRLFPLVLLIVSCAETFAQIPYYTELDTALMRERREQKIHIRYMVDQPYDSVSGRLLTKATADTTWTEYDKMGREKVFSYTNDDGSRAFVRIYFNSKGQVVRRFSYDGDSTNGFLDYWNYNEKGQVIREVSCTREGSQEQPFSADAFEYNDTGAMVREKTYYIHDGEEKRFSHSESFYYSTHMTIRVRMDKDGDTTYLDTVGGVGDDPYWSRYYRYIYDDDTRNARRMLVSSAETTVDTVNGLIREVYADISYSYDDGSLEEALYDTTYYDFKQNVLEVRDGQHIEKFFYDANGDLEYSITYNRQMQPIMRSTESYEYYK